MYTYKRKLRAGTETALLGSGAFTRPTDVAVHLIVHVDENGETIRLSRRNNASGPAISYGTLSPGECTCFWLGSPDGPGAPAPASITSELLGIFAVSDRDCFVICTLLSR